jgi:hypothetical protein
MILVTARDQQPKFCRSRMIYSGRQAENGIAVWTYTKLGLPLIGAALRLFTSGKA